MGLLNLLRSIFTKAPAPKGAEDPVEAALETPAAAPIDRRARQRINAKPGTRALIIDDSPTIVAALSKILRSAGFTTLSAENAESGIEIAKSEHPELVFLDIVLPGMNGFAALRTMRRDPSLRNIPIIMISGNEQATEQFFGSRIGADDFMKKPFSRLEVFARIERLLDANLVPHRVITGNN